MKRILTYTIDEQNNGKTILEFLKNEGYTHSLIVALKKTKEGILRNKKWAYVNERLAAKDELIIQLEESEKNTSILPVYGKFEIIYEDEDLLLINKPAHMPIHPSLGHYENTLANAVLYYFSQKEEAIPFRCVNRLDRDTTGLTIIAKNLLASAILNEQMKSKQIKRTYYAICEGLVNEAGTIDAPIARKDGSLVERTVDDINGETAITHYKRLQYDEKKDLSFVKLALDTGRTHQIRVHMKHIGHPLLGDFMYNPDFRYISRQALHAGELEFIHPITKEKMHFSCELPLEMKCIL